MRKMLEREQHAKGMALLDTVEATDLAHFISTSVHFGGGRYTTH